VERIEWGYGYAQAHGLAGGPVPEWEARGRALCDHSVVVYFRNDPRADWNTIDSPNPDDLARFHAEPEVVER
jgi:hypothetical protein